MQSGASPAPWRRASCVRWSPWDALPCAAAWVALAPVGRQMSGRGLHAGRLPAAHGLGRAPLKSLTFDAAESSFKPRFPQWNSAALLVKLGERFHEVLAQ